MDGLTNFFHKIEEEDSSSEGSHSHIDEETKEREIESKEIKIDFN